MRNVVVGALQQNFQGVEDTCNCLCDHYINHLDSLMENHVKKHLNCCLGLLKEAGNKGCDIVVTGEDCCSTSAFIVDSPNRTDFELLVEASAKVAQEKIAEIARRYSMYIIACYNKKISGLIYNVASVFDRSGVLIGEYKKSHLPPNELWQVTPGNEINLFDLDFGRIGISICYDMMFPEMSAVQGLQGAEIIFHPTAGYGWYDSIGEATLRTRANDNSFYIVTAKNYVYNAAGRSSVIDFWGQILADAGFYENVVVTREIDLDFPKTQPDWHYQTHMSGVSQMRTRKLAERRPDLYDKLSMRLHEPQKPPDADRREEIIKRIQDGSCHW